MDSSMNVREDEEEEYEEEEEQINEEIDHELCWIIGEVFGIILFLIFVRLFINMMGHVPSSMSGVLIGDSQIMEPRLEADVEHLVKKLVLADNSSDINGTNGIEQSSKSILFGSVAQFIQKLVWKFIDFSFLLGSSVPTSEMANLSAITIPENNRYMSKVLPVLEYIESWLYNYMLNAYKTFFCHHEESNVVEMENLQYPVSFKENLIIQKSQKLLALLKENTSSGHSYCFYNETGYHIDDIRVPLSIGMKLDYVGKGSLWLTILIGLTLIFIFALYGWMFMMRYVFVLRWKKKTIQVNLDMTARAEDCSATPPVAIFTTCTDLITSEISTQRGSSDSDSDRSGDSGDSNEEDGKDFRYFNTKSSDLSYTNLKKEPLLKSDDYTDNKDNQYNTSATEIISHLELWKYSPIRDYPTKNYKKKLKKKLKGYSDGINTSAIGSTDTSEHLITTFISGTDLITNEESTQCGRPVTLCGIENGTRGNVNMNEVNHIPIIPSHVHDDVVDSIAQPPVTESNLLVEESIEKKCCDAVEALAVVNTENENLRAELVKSRNENKKNLVKIEQLTAKLRETELVADDVKYQVDRILNERDKATNGLIKTVAAFHDMKGRFHKSQKNENELQSLIDKIPSDQRKYLYELGWRCDDPVTTDPLHSIPIPLPVGDGKDIIPQLPPLYSNTESYEIFTTCTSTQRGSSVTMSANENERGGSVNRKESIQIPNIPSGSGSDMEHCIETPVVETSKFCMEESPKDEFCDTVEVLTDVINKYRILRAKLVKYRNENKKHVKKIDQTLLELWLRETELVADEVICQVDRNLNERDKALNELTKTEVPICDIKRCLRESEKNDDELRSLINKIQSNQREYEQGWGCHVPVRTIPLHLIPIPLPVEDGNDFIPQLPPIYSNVKSSDLSYIHLKKECPLKSEDYSKIQYNQYTKYSSDYEIISEVRPKKNCPINKYNFSDRINASSNRKPNTSEHFATFTTGNGSNNLEQSIQSGSGFRRGAFMHFIPELPPLYCNTKSSALSNTNLKKEPPLRSGDYSENKYNQYNKSATEIISEVKSSNNSPREDCSTKNYSDGINISAIGSTGTSEHLTTFTSGTDLITYEESTQCGSGVTLCGIENGTYGNVDMNEVNHIPIIPIHMHDDVVDSIAQLKVTESNLPVDESTSRELTTLQNSKDTKQRQKNYLSRLIDYLREINIPFPKIRSTVSTSDYDLHDDSDEWDQSVDHFMDDTHDQYRNTENMV